MKSQSPDKTVVQLTSKTVICILHKSKKNQHGKSMYEHATAGEFLVKHSG